MKRGSMAMTERQREIMLRVLTHKEASAATLLASDSELQAMYRQNWVLFRDAPGVGKNRIGRLLWTARTAGAAKLAA